jgi:hypothetical protein
VRREGARVRLLRRQLTGGVSGRMCCVGVAAFGGDTSESRRVCVGFVGLTISTAAVGPSRSCAAPSVPDRPERRHAPQPPAPPRAYRHHTCHPHLTFLLSTGSSPTPKHQRSTRHTPFGAHFSHTAPSLPASLVSASDTASHHPLRITPIALRTDTLARPSHHHVPLFILRLCLALASAPPQRAASASHRRPDQPKRRAAAVSRDARVSPSPRGV